MPSAPPPKKREPRKYERIVLRDQSCSPDAALILRLVTLRHPIPEDIAIVQAWAPRYRA